MQQKLITRAKFARLAQVDPSTVTRVADTLLKDAICNGRIDAAHPAAIEYLKNRERKKMKPSSPNLDPLYDEAVEVYKNEWRYSTSFLKEKLRIGYDRALKIEESMRANGVMTDDKKTELRGQAVVKEEKKRNAKQPEINGVVSPPDDLNEIGSWTIDEVVQKFGASPAFLDWVKALKEIEAIVDRRIKNNKALGKLVSIKFVEQHVISNFDNIHSRMLDDGSKTITLDVIEKHKSGLNSSEIQEHVSEIISSFIEKGKKNILKEIP